MKTWKIWKYVIWEYLIKLSMFIVVGGLALLLAVLCE